MALFILWASVQSTLAVSSYEPLVKQTSPDTKHGGQLIDSVDYAGKHVLAGTFG